MKNIERIAIKKQGDKYGKTGNRKRGKSMDASNEENRVPLIDTSVLYLDGIRKSGDGEVRV